MEVNHNNPNKPCVKCGSTERYKNGKCKVCARKAAKKYHHQWYPANRAKKLAYQKRRRENNGSVPSKPRKPKRLNNDILNHSRSMDILQTYEAEEKMRRRLPCEIYRKLWLYGYHDKKSPRWNIINELKITGGCPLQHLLNKDFDTKIINKLEQTNYIDCYIDDEGVLIYYLPKPREANINETITEANSHQPSC